MKHAKILGGFALLAMLALDSLLAPPIFSNPAHLPHASRASLSQTRFNTAYKPEGLVAVLTNTPGQPLDLSVLSNPSISGAALQIHWRDIEPAEGRLDWTTLDSLIWGAEQSGKWVQLLIFPGFFTPRWALKGVDTARFAIQYGPGKGTVLRLPMPWDSVYLGRWTAFLHLLSVRYGESAALRVIAAGGPTSVSDETTMPSTPQDRIKWQSKGYTQSKYVAAWTTVLTAYAHDFPNQYVSLAGGAGTDSIVGIDDLGKIARGNDLGTKQEIVDSAIALLGSRFALQNSNLDGNPDTHKSGISYVIGYNGQVITGFQLRTTASADGMGADGNPPLALKRAIDNGMRTNSAGQHVNYIEIYAKDVVAKDMQPDLRAAAHRFPSTLERTAP